MCSADKTASKHRHNSEETLQSHIRPQRKDKSRQSYKRKMMGLKTALEGGAGREEEE